MLYIAWRYLRQPHNYREAYPFAVKPTPSARRYAAAGLTARASLATGFSSCECRQMYLRPSPSFGGHNNGGETVPARVLWLESHPLPKATGGFDHDNASRINQSGNQS